MLRIIRPQRQNISERSTLQITRQQFTDRHRQDSKANCEADSSSAVHQSLWQQGETVKIGHIDFADWSFTVAAIEKTKKRAVHVTDHSAPVTDRYQQNDPCYRSLGPSDRSTSANDPCYSSVSLSDRSTSTNDPCYRSLGPSDRSTSANDPSYSSVSLSDRLTA